MIVKLSKTVIVEVIKTIACEVKMEEYQTANFEYYEEAFEYATYLNEFVYDVFILATEHGYMSCWIDW